MKRSLEKLMGIDNPMGYVHQVNQQYNIFSSTLEEEFEKKKTTPIPYQRIITDAYVDPSLSLIHI